MSIQIRIDDAELQRVQQRLGELQHKAPNAIASALNRSISNIKANVPKEVRKNYHVKTADIKETLKIFKASASKLQAKVTSSGRTLGLNKFKVSPMTVNPKRKSQLKIAVEKTGIKQILGAFILNLNGAKVFTRSGEKHSPTKGSYAGKGVLREKINRKFGPSVPQMIGNETTVNKINQDAYTTYETRINHEMNRLLSRLGAN